MLPLSGGILTLIFHFRNTTTNLLTTSCLGLALFKVLLMACVVHDPIYWVIPIFNDTLLSFAVKLQIDNLTIVMLLLINFISLIIHRYSITYLSSDKSQGRFMAQLSLLTSSVSFLVMSGNLITAFIGWQFVGLTLYILLNHYHYAVNANKAAKKNFIINRVGDISFLIAVIICYRYYHTTDFALIFQDNVPVVHFLSYSIAINTLVVLLIFVAVMTKSAQFPFHIWLPDTMQAPTPVSAMMHAGVINSGGFLLARIAQITATSYISENIIFTVGLITVIMASFFMLTQSDVKKQLAYSTMGQMGFMIMQCGIGLYTAAVFHLVTHGFFKASLFLGAGNNVGVHKHAHVHPLKSGVISIILTAMLLFFFYKHLSQESHLYTAYVITAIFVAITMSQLFNSIIQMEVTSFIKAILVAVAAGAMYLYYILINYADGILSTSVTNDPNSFNHYKLLMVIIALTIQVLIWLNSLYINLIPKKYLLYLYHLSRNKLFIEEFYRKFLLAPYRKLGDKINFILYNQASLSEKKARLSRGLLILIATISILYTAYGVTNVSSIAVDYVSILINQFIFITVLIAANRAKTIRSLNYYLAVAQINVVNMGLFPAHSKVADIAIFQIINSIFIFLAIRILLNSHERKEDVVFIEHNTLVWSGLYFTALLFLGIGIPGTAMFISEVNVLYSLSQENLIFLFIGGVGFLFMAITIMRSLQEHVFTLKSSFLQKKAYLYPVEHCFIIACICINIFNGINPGWLIRIINNYL